MASSDTVVGGYSNTSIASTDPVYAAYQKADVGVEIISMYRIYPAVPPDLRTCSADLGALVLLRREGVHCALGLSLVQRPQGWEYVAGYLPGYVCR